MVKGRRGLNKATRKILSQISLIVFLIVVILGIILI